MKIKTLFALAMIATPLVSFAHAIPESCPSRENILSALPTFKIVNEREANHWVAYQVSSFDTPDEWTVVIGEVQAADVDEARAKFTYSMSTLKLTDGPIYYREFGFTECKYATADGLLGGAVNPPIDPDQAQAKNKSFTFA